MLSIWANKSYIHLCQQNYHQALIMAENILKSDLMITPGMIDLFIFCRQLFLGTLCNNF